MSSWAAFGICIDTFCCEEGEIRSTVTMWWVVLAQLCCMSGVLHGLSCSILWANYGFQRQTCLELPWSSATVEHIYTEKSNCITIHPNLYYFSFSTHNI